MIDKAGSISGAAKLQADYVVLRKLSLAEWPTRVFGGQKIEGLSRKRRSNSSGWHDSADRFAGIHVFRMPLGKFVEVGISNPIFPGSKLQRENGNLPHVKKRRHIVIVDLERERMHDILSIMESDNLILAATRNLTGLHCLKDGIQTICLRSRTGPACYGLVDAR